jgi:hypothetical protein
MENKCAKKFNKGHIVKWKAAPKSLFHVDFKYHQKSGAQIFFEQRKMIVDKHVRSALHVHKHALTINLISIHLHAVFFSYAKYYNSVMRLFCYI